MTCICSLYLGPNVLPVCPMYFIGQSMHFIWYTRFARLRTWMRISMRGCVMRLCNPTLPRTVLTSNTIMQLNET
jgi:hypothetical protein